MSQIKLTGQAPPTVLPDIGIHSLFVDTDNDNKLSLMDSDGNVTYAMKGDTGIGSNVSAQIFLSAAGGMPATTNGCSTPTQIEIATYYENYRVLDFDKDTVEYAYWQVAMPSDYNGGSITAKVYWLHESTTTNFKVRWGIGARCFSNGEGLGGDYSFTNAATSDDEGGTTRYLYVSPETTTFTPSNTPAGGDLISFVVWRQADNATYDTLAIDARLLGVQITYTRT